MPDNLRQILLETIEASLHAQLLAVRRLRHPGGSAASPPGRKPRKGRSQLNVVFDILREAAQPLHISDIIEQAQKRFQLQLDRESLVSALTKRIARGDRFLRTAPNTFALRPNAHQKGEE
jgi:hypothetical protein